MIQILLWNAKQISWKTKPLECKSAIVFWLFSILFNIFLARFSFSNKFTYTLYIQHVWFMCCLNQHATIFILVHCLCFFSIYKMYVLNGKILHDIVFVCLLLYFFYFFFFIILFSKQYIHYTHISSKRIEEK